MWRIGLRPRLSREKLPFAKMRIRLWSHTMPPARLSPRVPQKTPKIRKMKVGTAGRMPRVRRRWDYPVVLGIAASTAIIPGTSPRFARGKQLRSAANPRPSSRHSAVLALSVISALPWGSRTALIGRACCARPVWYRWLCTGRRQRWWG